VEEPQTVLLHHSRTVTLRTQHRCCTSDLVAGQQSRRAE